jgi:hypothetical protein
MYFDQKKAAGTWGKVGNFTIGGDNPAGAFRKSELSPARVNPTIEVVLRNKGIHKHLFADAIALKYLDYSTGVEELMPSLPQNTIRLNCYPNPAYNEVYYKFDLPVLYPVSIRLYNILGEEVITKNMGNILPGEYIIRLDLSGIPEGVYFYRFSAGLIINTGKIVIKR